MKKLFLLSLLLVFSFSFSTLSAQSWFWGKEGKPSSPFGGGDTYYDHCTAADDRGNAYITGIFTDTLSFGSYTLKGPYFGIYVTKYDSNGNVKWASQSGEASSAIGTSVASCNDGSVYIAGYFNDTITFGIDTLKTTGSDMYLIKYDSNGNVMWARQSKGGQISGNPSLATDKAGNAYITGNYSNSVTFGSLVLSSIGSDIFIVKYDKNGNAIWANQGILSSGASTGTGNSVAIDKVGNVLVAGSFVDTITFGIYVLNENVPGNGSFILKYNSAGTLIWARQSGTTGVLSIITTASISADGAGNSYVTGNFSDTVTFGPYMLRQVNGDVFIVKYDSNGVVRWTVQPIDLNNNTWNAYSISSDTTKTGGAFLALAGSGGSPFKLKILPDTFKFSNLYSQACLLVHLDSSGKALCGTIFSEGGEDDGDGIGVDHSGRYVYYGGDLQTKTIFGKDTLIYGGDMPYVARWQQCQPPIIEETNPLSQANSIILYPNPNNGRFAISAPSLLPPSGGGVSYLDIFNVLGEKIYSSSFNIHNSPFTINVGDRPSGVYFYRIITETGDLAFEGKFIIQK